MIALDVHVIGERETGNELYTLNLVRGLLRVAPDRTFALLTPHPHLLPEDVRSHPRARVVRVLAGNSLLRVPLALPYAAWRVGASLLHVNYILPPACPCPGVITVHDLAYDLFPADAPPRDRLVLGPLMPLSIRRAAAIIAVSESTKRDIMRRFGVAEERVTVTHEATPSHIHPVTDPVALACVRQKYGLAQTYILAVGNLQPRKNVARLIQAYGLLRREGLVGCLAIVGKARWRESEVFRLVRELGLEKSVIFTGYVPDEDMSALYSGAAALAYPSLYEGFGLPVLEAMTCGTPVVTSNVSSLPEVAGDAALLVDPTSKPDLAAALRAVLTDGHLAADLRARGQARAASFSWAETARRTLAVYERVVSVTK